MNYRNPIKLKSSYFFAILLLCIGFLCGFYKTPLHLKYLDAIQISRSLKKKISQSIHEKSGIWERIKLSDKYEYDDKIALNNFELQFTRVEESRISKVGAAHFNREEILFINQNDSVLLKKLGLKPEQIHRNGGIKNIFMLNGREYAYVAHSKGECFTASIFDITLSKSILELPCLPKPDTVDLNGVGGATVSTGNNEILLSIGTPTMHSGTISGLAQDRSTFWGKIIQIRQEGEAMSFQIYTSGHRNPQGMLMHDKRIYSTEHGPMGGDEINIVERGTNYGWPLQSLGSDYSFHPINKDYRLESGMSVKQPLYAFVPSIGISDIQSCPDIYADYYAPLQCISIGSMRGTSIYFLIFKDEKVLFIERMDFGSRIRKFAFLGNKFYALTDWNGYIAGEITRIKPTLP